MVLSKNHKILFFFKKGTVKISEFFWGSVRSTSQRAGGERGVVAPSKNCSVNHKLICGKIKRQPLINLWQNKAGGGIFFGNCK